MRRPDTRLLPWTLLLALGCGEGGKKASDGSAGAGASACESDLEFFRKQISEPILERVCIQCHNPQGQAHDSQFVLMSPAETGYLQHNFAVLKDLAAFERDGVSLILLKPTARIDHEGGEQIKLGSPEYESLEELVRRFKKPVTCDDDGVLGILDKIQPIDLPATLRKAKVQLLGQLPTADELQAVAEGGDEALDRLVRGYADQPQFLNVLKLWFNDLLHTDKYLGGERATSLLPDEEYPHRFYYHDASDDDPVGHAQRQYTNDSLAREPLDLIAYVVSHDKPFTEVLTADYTVVNPFTAKVYGLNVHFDDPTDRNEFHEARIQGYPHAGVLTTPVFLNRFPTTDTNRNRHRSRMVWKLFLATDILKKAQQPVDPTRIRDHNPTMNNPQCTVCHAQVDPLAGAFMNFDAQGRYAPREEGWYADMRPPGFGTDSIPPDDWSHAIQWAAKKVAADDRFALAAVVAVYTGLVGHPPLENPTDQSDPAFEPKRAFVAVEQDFLQKTKDVFVKSGYNLKAIVPEVVHSPFYRAQAAFDLTPDEAEELDTLGTTHLLTPEELDAKLHAVLGTGWQKRITDHNQLLHPDEFRFFYGGIDSDQILDRVTEPNGIMANIGMRMANEMACFAVPRDFTRDKDQRNLFPDVELSYLPEDRNGFEVPEVVTAIRKNIRYLHYKILGEVLEPGSAEEEATWQLFLQTWREGINGVRNEQISQDLPGYCQATYDFDTNMDLPNSMRVTRDSSYTVRAWMAVVTYLLADWRFLYHQ